MGVREHVRVAGGIGELEAAVAAYQAALTAVDDAVAAVSQRRAEVPRARAALAAAIVAAYRGGMRVGEIAKLTGYGREQVRRILRAAGVEAPERD